LFILHDHVEKVNGKLLTKKLDLQQKSGHQDKSYAAFFDHRLGNFLRRRLYFWI